MKLQVFNKSELALKISEGSPAIFPTDTLPALTSSPRYAYKLWDIKQRSKNKPLILMGSSTEELFKYVSSEALTDARKLAASYWPGALTMVVPAKGSIVNCLNPGSSNLGIRVPALSQARQLLALTGPLATTSANLSGAEPLMIAEEAQLCFPTIPLLGPLPWPKTSGLASTVILWKSLGCWDILRIGGIKVSFGKN